MTKRNVMRKAYAEHDLRKIRNSIRRSMRLNIAACKDYLRWAK